MAFATDAQIHRDRTEEFFVLRRAARQQQRWMRGETASPAAPGPATEPAEEVAVPSWAAVVGSFAELEKSVTTRMQRLFAAQRDVFTPKFGAAADTSEELQKDVEKLSDDVQRFLRELERLLATGVRVLDETSVDEARAASNVRKHLSTRLNGLVTAFRHGQQSYAKQLKKRDERVRQLRTFGDEEVHQRLETEEKVAGYLEMGYTQDDIKELLLMEDQALEMNAEVQKIMASINELNSMFKDLRDMVVEQGTVLDRIDYNIEQAHTKISAGVKELQGAREQQKKCIVS